MEQLITNIIRTSNGKYKVVDHGNGMCHLEVEGKDVSGKVPRVVVEAAISRASSGLLLG